MGVHQLGTEIKPFQGKSVFVGKEELMTVSDCESEGVIAVFVIAGANEAATYFSALTHLREGSLVGDLGTSGQPGKEGDLDCIEIVCLGSRLVFCMKRKAYHKDSDCRRNASVE